MVMQNGSLEAIWMLTYVTLGFTMEAEATLDGYGRWKSNQCCNKTRHLYIKFHAIQEHGLTARYRTHAHYSSHNGTVVCRTLPQSMSFTVMWKQAY